MSADILKRESQTLLLLLTLSPPLCCVGEKKGIPENLGLPELGHLCCCLQEATAEKDATDLLSCWKRKKYMFSEMLIEQSI